jgi:hypothetical protein
VTIPENVAAILYMILADRKMSAKKIETLAIYQEKVGSISHNILDMRNLSAN